MKINLLPKQTPHIYDNFKPFLSYYNPETDHFLFSSYLLKKRRLRKYALRVSHMFFRLVEREYIAVLFNNIKTYISFRMHQQIICRNFTYKKNLKDVKNKSIISTN